MTEEKAREKGRDNRVGAIWGQDFQSLIGRLEGEINYVFPHSLIVPSGLGECSKVRFEGGGLRTPVPLSTREPCIPPMLGSWHRLLQSYWC